MNTTDSSNDETEQQAAPSATVVDAPATEELEPGTQAADGLVETPSATQWLRVAVIGGVPLLAVLFGAGRELWSLVIVLALMGAGLLLCPPGRVLPRSVLLLLLAIVMAPLAALVPLDVFGGRLLWLEPLIRDFGIKVSASVSPQHSVTLEAWFRMCFALVWFAGCLAQEYSKADRRNLVRLLAVGTGVLAVLTILQHEGVLRVAFWPQESSLSGKFYGPFANRNHTSTLFAISCVLCVAAAYDAFRRRSRSWCVFALVALFPFAATLQNTSRMGLLLLVLGVTLWLVTAGIRQSLIPNLAIAISSVMVIATILIVARGDLASKFSAVGANDGLMIGMSSRLMIYWEALKMAAARPWLGAGLGNFEHAFAQTVSFHEPRMHFVHPESDILWLLCEGGLLTLIPFLVLGWLLWRAKGKWFIKRDEGAKDVQDRRLRNAVAIAAGIGIVQSVVDVPLHSLGYSLVISLLLGAALDFPTRAETASMLQKCILLIAGFLLVAAGGAVWAASRNHLELPGNAGAQLLVGRALEAVKSSRPKEALPLMDRAVAKAPLNHSLYFIRAQVHLVASRNVQAALEDFTRSRALMPHYARLCFDEGVIWTAYRPSLAVVAWREYLKRHPESGPGVHGYYRQMLNHAAKNKELREELWRLATTPDLKLDFMEVAAQPGEEFENCLQELLYQQPKFHDQGTTLLTPSMARKLVKQPMLQGLDSAKLQQLFNTWRVKGDLRKLVTLLEQSPALQKDGWRVLAEEYARKRDFRQAYDLAVRSLPPPPPPRSPQGTSIAELQLQFNLNPGNYAAGIDLYYAMRLTGDLDEYLRVLEETMKIKDCPNFVKREAAYVLAQKGDHEAAWNHIRSYIDTAAQAR